MFGIDQTNQKSSCSGASQANGFQRCLTRCLSRLASGQQGSAMVEMALVTPLVLLLMTGMFSVSFVTYQKLQLAEAVSTGARQLAVIRGDTDPCATVANTVYAAAPTLSKTSMKLSFVLNGTSYNNTATCTAGATNMVAGKTAKLTATYPCVLKWYKMAATTCSLTVSTSEVIQ